MYLYLELIIYRLSYKYIWYKLHKCKLCYIFIYHYILYIAIHLIYEVRKIYIDLKTHFFNVLSVGIKWSKGERSSFSADLPLGNTQLCWDSKESCRSDVIRVPADGLSPVETGCVCAQAQYSSWNCPGPEGYPAEIGAFGISIHRVERLTLHLYWSGFCRETDWQGMWNGRHHSRTARLPCRAAAALGPRQNFSGTPVPATPVFGWCFDEAPSRYWGQLQTAGIHLICRMLSQQHLNRRLIT